MFPIIYACGFVIAAWKWGGWKSWRKYLPTIQYFIGCDMLYDLLCYNYPLWSYPHPPNVLPSHLAVNLFRMFTTYPSFILIYLYRFPENNFVRKLGYILAWAILWALDELYMVLRGICVYAHGWSYAWSVGFLCVMLPMLKLHHHHPLWAYLLSVPIIVFLLLWFHVPVFQFR